MTTKIEWAEDVWNPVTGCTRVSSGCDNCYAVRMTHRLESMKQDRYGGLTVLNGKGERHFNGVVRCHEDLLGKPLRRKKPTRYFVNSMSDLFHEKVPFDFIGKVFAVMAICPQHTFIVLTKRSERAAQYLAEHPDCVDGLYAIHRMFPRRYNSIIEAEGFGVPINLWLLMSAEDQTTYDERIPYLLQCPVHVRGVSLEPLLGPIDLRLADELPGPDFCYEDIRHNLHWVIVGGESGPKARPMHPDWPRSIRDQCKDAGVPLFFKQWGEWHPGPGVIRIAEEEPERKCVVCERTATHCGEVGPNYIVEHQNGCSGDLMMMYRAGKKRTGRTLDGLEHSEYQKREN